MSEITLYGTVGGSFFWDEDAFTASDVRAMLDGVTGDVTVRINSGGGIATEAQAIYTMLKDHDGEVHVVVDAVAASAASLIAMAGDTITMRLGSWMLIHDPAQMFGSGRGTADDHRSLAAFLDKIGDAYAEVYAMRSGKTKEEARDIMRAETVLLGEEAIDAGFATHFEGSVESDRPAAFDYRVYANAPEAARIASESMGEAPCEEAVVAAIAGLARNHQKEPTMASKSKAAAGGSAATIEDPASQGQQPAAPQATAQGADPGQSGGDPAPKMQEPLRGNAPEMSARQVSKLYQVGAKMGIETDKIGEIVEANTDFEKALDAVTAVKVAEADQRYHVPRPTAQVLRDERDTRREGMTQALTAQIAGRDPESDASRPYMTMPIVEMAAECIDYRGAMRSAGDKIDVMMQATHSTSDFPAIFENALNKVLLERYMVQMPTYREISRRRDFNDFRPHPMVRAGDFPKMQEVNEGGEIKFGSFSDNKETAVLRSYASGLRITRQMMINDDLGAIDDILADFGAMVAHFEEETFYSFMVDARLSDNQLVYRTQRNTLASTAAAISVTSLSEGRTAIRQRQSLDGKKLNLSPSILLVSPEKETEAEQIVAPLQPQESGSVNPFSGRMQVVTTAQLSGNAWYLFADPAAPGGACFTYGYLRGQEAPRIRTEEPFGHQGMSMTVEHDFGLGAIDFRGTWKNPGE